MSWVKQDSSFLMMNKALSGNCFLAGKEPHCWDPTFLDRLVCSVWWLSHYTRDLTANHLFQVMCKVSLPDNEDCEVTTEPDSGPGGDCRPQCESPPAGQRPPGYPGEQETPGVVSGTSRLSGSRQALSGLGVGLSRLSNIVQAVPW